METYIYIKSPLNCDDLLWLDRSLTFLLVLPLASPNSGKVTMPQYALFGRTDTKTCRDKDMTDRHFPAGQDGV